MLNCDEKHILCDFSLGRWCLLKTCGTDSVSTGFKHFERMICSQVCPASSNENKEEVGVLTQIPIQCHIILQSEIQKLTCVEGILVC